MCFVSQCSASCGPAVRKRELKCGEKSIHGKLITFPQRRCRNIKKPNIDLEEACNNGPCPSQTLYNMVSGWYSSPWQQVGMGSFLVPPIPSMMYFGSVDFFVLKFNKVALKCYLCSRATGSHYCFPALPFQHSNCTVIELLHSYMHNVFEDLHRLPGIP